jgi:hypothetical protein
MPLGRPKEIKYDWDWMEHMSSWSPLTTLIYWVKTQIPWNTEAVLEVSKEVGLEGNTERTKYVVMSHHQNAGQNDNVMRANKTFSYRAKL